MSVVVAYVKDGTVYLGADTQSSSGHEQQNFTSPERRKIRLMKNGMLVAHCGAVFNAQRTFLRSELFSLPENGELTKDYVVTNIAHKLFEYYDENDLLKTDDEDGTTYMDGRFLIAYKDKLFVISNRFGVIECKHFAAIGVGEPYAAPLLLNTDDDKPLIPQLLDTLRICAACDTTISAPYWTIDTANLKFTLHRK